MQELNAQQLKTYLDHCQLEPNNEQPLLLDVRQPWEVATCQIECDEINNCAFIPMAQIPTKIESLDASRQTVVICHHGIRSRSVAHYLEQNGFNNVINLSGGVAQWAKMVDSQMAVY